jgi:hypothetical protein
MLEDLLQIIAQGGIHSYTDLTERLAVPESLVEAMVEDLARMGYLKAIADSCEGHCRGCSVGSCSITGPGRLWSLTEKGARVAAASQ